jgi:hypothetical protein
VADKKRGHHEFDAEFDAEFDPAADPPRDPALAAALRGLAGDTAALPEWERLHHTGETAAALHRARRRFGAPWWQHAAGWAGRAIPVGLAASIALAFGLRTLVPHVPAPEPVPPAATFETMLLTLLDDASEMTLPTDGDELLRAAFPIED